MILFAASLACAVLSASGSSIDSSIDPVRAARAFQELAWASADDGGKTWGRELYGPTLFFDRESGDVVANQADREGRLTQEGALFAGHVAPDFAGANTALTWAGVKWTVVLWPLPETSQDRLRLLLHESWHRIQDELGLPGASVRNEHLSSKEGRIWLLLEYRALAKALPAWGPERANALEDALRFRAFRRSLFPAAAAEEDRMEVHEGLAEYAGFACGALSNDAARYHMASRLKLAALKPALSYAFAYETGPGYGLLLDMDGGDWRAELTPRSSLSAELAAQNQIVVGTPTREDVLARAARYDGEALIAAETKKDEERQALAARYRHTLVDGPVLTLPLVDKGLVFDPNALVPLANEGTVYLGCKLIDRWGVLTVDGAALVDANFATARVPAPAPGELKGSGWKLELSPGWTLMGGMRAGDFVIVKE